MAFDTTEIADVDGHGFCVFAFDADLTTTTDGEQLVAAVAGKSIYIEHLFISCVSAINVSIGEGVTSNAVVDVWTTFEFVATSGAPIDIHFSRPVKLTAATALGIESSGAGYVTAIVSGYYK